MSGKVLPIGSRESWRGGAHGDVAMCLLAPNPSAWTLDGTNTWILAEPGTTEALIIDPGPSIQTHLDAVAAHLDERELHATSILLTHGHPDHSEGARALAERLGVGVRALDPAHRLGDEGLVGGEVVLAGDLEVRVISTPGHTEDSLCFFADGLLLTGDTILGRGTTVIAWPDGRLADYLASLERLRALAETSDASAVLPGHGPVLADPVGIVDAYLQHRMARLAQVREILNSGVTEVDEIVAIAYADVPREVWPAAGLSVRAQVEYLLGG